MRVFETKGLKVEKRNSEEILIFLIIINIYVHHLYNDTYHTQIVIIIQ